jgi:hypothetical protein
MIDAHPTDGEQFGKGSLIFKPRPASVRDADTLNHERYTSVRHHGLGHNNCEPGEHKFGEHLNSEAVSYEEVLGQTARGTGKDFEGSTLFATKPIRRECGRPLASGLDHIMTIISLTLAEIALLRQ